MQKETIPELVFGDEHSLLSPVPKNMQLIFGHFGCSAKLFRVTVPLTEE